MDSSILQQVLEVVNIILRENYKDREKGLEVGESSPLLKVLSLMISMLQKTDDLFLLQYGTTELKTFACVASKEVVSSESIVAELLSVTKRLLLPTTI